MPDELIEIVGQYVIGTDQAGLREWCQATSTCTRLWKMDLPGSASSCHLDLDNNIRGKYRVDAAYLCHACKPDFMLNRAGAPWVMERIQTVRNLSIKGDEDQMVRLDAEVLYQITKSIIRLSGSFKNLATLVGSSHAYMDTVPVRLSGGPLQSLLRVHPSNESAQCVWSQSISGMVALCRPFKFVRVILSPSIMSGTIEQAQGTGTFAAGYWLCFSVPHG